MVSSSRVSLSGVGLSWLAMTSSCAASEGSVAVSWLTSTATGLRRGWRLPGRVAGSQYCAHHGDDACRDSECGQYGQHRYRAPARRIARRCCRRCSPTSMSFGMPRIGAATAATRSAGITGLLLSSGISLRSTQSGSVGEHAAQRWRHRSIGGPVLLLLVPRQARTGSDDEQPIW